MILYFDCLMKDAPLFPGAYTELDKIRAPPSSYKFKPRVDVTKYALASYAEIPWSNVIIRYQIRPESEEQKKDFEKFVKKIWPKAHIFYGVSETQDAFKEMMKLINRMDDNWIYYVGNNDHPFMSTSLNLLNKCLEKAKELEKKYERVSIDCSHYPEPLHLAKKGTTIHDIGFPNSKIIEENVDFSVAYFPRGFSTSRQIVNKKLLNYWVCAKDIGKSPIWRLEEMNNIYVPKLQRRSQIVILPKKEICAHFDGYSHTKGTGYFIPSALVPPLFIPSGFFESKIKIAYGYDKPREGWVNINPLKERYSFDDPKNGTDLMISLKDLPLFWKKRIKKIDINPRADLEKLEKAAEEKKRKIENPYFTRNFWNFPLYEAYIYQFRMRNLIKRVLSTIKPVGTAIKNIEKKYGIKL